MAAVDGEYQQAVLHAAEQHPRVDIGQDATGAPAKYSYGTAGFRMKDKYLDHIVMTVGIVAGLRSRRLGGKTIGVMITASHNPAEDNGVKIVEPQGEMLDAEWEKHTAFLANCTDGPQSTADGYAQLVKELKIDQSKPASVIFARDTRPSGTRLVKALVAGFEATGVTYTDYKILTTPQLHYMVKATNTQGTSHPYGVVSEQGYCDKLASAFNKAIRYARPKGKVTVDCANGVGAPKLKDLLKHLGNDLDVRVVNDEIEKAEVLNNKCGADFVKTQQRVPAGFDGKPFDRWASFDGDADRIVYYFVEDGNVFRLLDGDRIATLAASFISELVHKSGLADKLRIAVVQTAYANGASTKYIESNLKMKVECTPTGVKHLHHAALRSDIGVYFEANGHGTVLFSSKTLARIHNHEPESPAQMEALECLRAVTDLINQTVGDALSDLLLVETALAYKEFSVKEWLATYTDLPNKLAKVVVKDRSEYVTVEGSAERKLRSPEGLQEKIDLEVAKYRQGRCFVRPSGTEDVVRVYAEAADKFDCENMVQQVSDLILRN